MLEPGTANVIFFVVVSDNVKKNEKKLFFFFVFRYLFRLTKNENKI
jgi:hypothetical protein